MVHGRSVYPVSNPARVAYVLFLYLIEAGATTSTPIAAVSPRLQMAMDPQFRYHYCPPHFRLLHGPHADHMPQLYQRPRDSHHQSHGCTLGVHRLRQY